MISVIVPIYNIEQYLPQCIESVTNQIYTNLEIILVDDGSTDLSGSICDEYAEKDSRIKVIHKENGGLVSARKAGANIAAGEYIGYVDGDDWIEPDTYQKLIENGQDADIITFACYEEHGDYRTLKENKVQEGLYVTGQDKELLYQTMFMNGVFYEFGIMPTLWSKLFRRELLVVEQNRVSDLISYGEDAACTFPCLMGAASVYVTNYPLYHYRQRQGSIVKGSSKVPKSNFREIYHLLNSKYERAFHIKEILMGQLHCYMWFILLVKAYEGTAAGMVFFPFTKVTPNKRIAIYGAGGFGKTIKIYCDTARNIEVIGWADLHYDAYRNQGMDVISVDELQKSDFDFVVISVLNERLAEDIKEDFIKRGISEEKIDWVKKSVLEEVELPEWVTK